MKSKRLAMPSAVARERPGKTKRKEEGVFSLFSGGTGLAAGSYRIGERSSGNSPRRAHWLSSPVSAAHGSVLRLPLEGGMITRGRSRACLPLGILMRMKTGFLLTPGPLLRSRCIFSRARRLRVRPARHWFPATACNCSKTRERITRRGSRRLPAPFGRFISRVILSTMMNAAAVLPTL